ncbi:MAG: hypothetical protein M3R63_13200 [Actinomycetota bacterium]|nr:hypothetical protein [Actinomycetota bacterium]
MGPRSPSTPARTPNPTSPASPSWACTSEVRRWRLHRWIGLNSAQVAKRINPIVRGWMQYCGAFYRSELYPLL